MTDNVKIEDTFIQKENGKRRLNHAAKEDYIQRIKEALQTQTTAWTLVAKLLHEVWTEFGDNSDYQEVLKQTKITENKAAKLRGIIEDAKGRLTGENSALFACTDSWTVLYDVTILPDAVYDSLVEDLNTYKGDGPVVVTSSDISKAKKGNVENAPADDFVAVYEIRVNKPALETLEFSGDDYEKMMGFICDLQDSVPYVRVVLKKQDIEEKMSGLQNVDRKWMEKSYKHYFDMAWKKASVNKDKTKGEQSFKNKSQAWEVLKLIAPELTEHDTGIDAGSIEDYWMDLGGGTHPRTADIYNKSSDLYRNSKKGWMKKLPTDQFQFANTLTDYSLDEGQLRNDQ